MGDRISRRLPDIIGQDVRDLVIKAIIFAEKHFKN